MLREEIEYLLLGALDKELKVEGEEIRTYLIETLVENLLKLEDSEEKLEMDFKPAKDFDQIIKAQTKEAPQVQAEEQSSLVIKTKDSITSKVGNSEVETTVGGIAIRFLK